MSEETMNLQVQTESGTLKEEPKFWDRPRVAASDFAPLPRVEVRTWLDQKDAKCDPERYLEVSIVFKRDNTSQATVPLALHGFREGSADGSFDPINLSSPLAVVHRLDDTDRRGNPAVWHAKCLGVPLYVRFSGDMLALVDMALL